MLRMADAGLYECQANTEPKNQFPINLIIEDTVAVISGDHDDDSDMMTMMIRTPGGVPEGRQSVEASLLSGPGGAGP